MRAGQPVSPPSHDQPVPEEDLPAHLDPALPGQQLRGGDPIVWKDNSLPLPPPPAGMPRPLRSPKSPTAAERERHALTHLPYASWCRYCVCGKRPNTPHRRIKTLADLPLLSGDYGFFGDGTGAQLTFLAVTVRPFGAYWAVVVDAKGPTPLMVNSLQQLIVGCGLVRFRYRSDK